MLQSIVSQKFLKKVVQKRKAEHKLDRIPDHRDDFPNLNEIEASFPYIQSLGTEFLKPVFKVMNGSIPNDILRKARLIYLIMSSNTAT